MKRIRLALLLSLSLLPLLLCGQAWGWGAEGHEAVGAIADRLLKGTPTAKQVYALLGKGANGQQITLKYAALWPDCARSVDPAPGFAFKKNDPYRARDCSIFLDSPGIDALVAYARANDGQCPYKDTPSQCHKSFHFADVSVYHRAYKEGYKGVEDYDVVNAINACIAYLKAKKDNPAHTVPSGAMFQIDSARTALLMLAHFVGDLHQPLHVGAVYLDPAGNRVNPDQGAFDPDSRTAGANLLKRGSQNLHHDWDTVSYQLGTAGNNLAYKAEAALLKTEDDPLESWAASWATESVLAARKAFVGVSFSKKAGDDWTVKATPPTYGADRKALQDAMINKAGARLAAILTAIYG